LSSEKYRSSKVFLEKNTGILAAKRYHVPGGSADEGVELLVGFNGTFFMSLMFFLSGLFAWQGVQAGGLEVSFVVICSD